MAGRIITVRHGRPDLSRDLRLSSREYGDWWARYDESGLHPDERPPAALINVAAGARTILTSTLPRAIETAREIIGEDRPVAADPLFVEAPLPPPPVPALRLSPSTWGVVSRLFWYFGYAPTGVESHGEARARVEEIAGRLAEQARSGDVLLCAHGYLNWMLDQRLRKQGWVRTERGGGNYYWSWRIYEPGGETVSARSPAVAE